jgi:hypothetical protein
MLRIHYPDWLKDSHPEPLKPCPDYEADNLIAYPMEACRYWGGGYICRQPDGRSCYWRGRKAEAI